MTFYQPRPFCLIILDGWGYSEKSKANAILQAKKPCWDRLWAEHAHTLLSGSGGDVGLPAGQMGNSEVGHMNIGAGRIIHQELTRIDLAIQDGSFFKNEALTKAIHTAQKMNKAIHIFGLLSDGGVHSHENHIHALLSCIAELDPQHTLPVYIHVFLDGRDTPPRSAKPFLERLLKKCKDLNCGKVVSLIGRYYAMDRDKRWDRTEKAYQLLAEGRAPFHATDAISALELAYARNENDEFVQATTISPDRVSPPIENGDIVFFMNFRADRARQLTDAFIHSRFTKEPLNLTFVTLTEYDKTYQVPVLFPSQTLTHTLGTTLSEAGLKQLRIAETEKYAHVTYFFNGGQESPLLGEDRILIPSPKVATYDLKPEMSALELTHKMVEAIKGQTYDAVICNYANPDMLGHTGNFSATIQAIETIDHCLEQITKALADICGEALITADHGNAECMFDEKTHQPHTAHTRELVPLLYVGRKATAVKAQGILADIAPTMLYLMGLQPPLEMTGERLFTLVE